MRKAPILKVAVLLMAVLGLFLGFHLSGMLSIRSYQLLNIMGLLYNLLAVFVLSEVLVSSANWKEFCVEWMAPVLLWSYVALPTGAIVGAVLEWLMHRGPSAYTVGFFAFGNMCIMSVYVGAALEYTVVLPRFFPKDMESRWRYLGFLLLLSGMLLQLIAGVMAL